MAMSNTLAINPAPIRELKNTAAMIGSKSYSRKNCFLTHLKQESQKICKNEVWSASQKTNAAEDTAAAPEDSRLQTSTAAAINSQAPAENTTNGQDKSNGSSADDKPAQADPAPDRANNKSNTGANPVDTVVAAVMECAAPVLPAGTINPVNGQETSGPAVQEGVQSLSGLGTEPDPLARTNLVAVSPPTDTSTMNAPNQSAAGTEDETLINQTPQLVPENKPLTASAPTAQSPEKANQTAAASEAVTVSPDLANGSTDVRPLKTMLSTNADIDGAPANDYQSASQEQKAAEPAGIPREMPDNTSLKQTHNSDSTSVSAPQTVGVKTRQNNSESGTNERSTAREQVKTGAASEESEYAGSELKAIMEQENQRTAVKKSSLLSGAAPAAEDETNNTLHDSAALFSKPAGETVKPAIAVRNADSAQLAFQPAVDSQEVLEQIVQKAELLNKQENSEIRIQLKPEFLGKMIIKIAVQEGAVTAHFVTDNHNVKHILETNMQNLRQNLEASGLKVERTEVNVSLDSGRNYSDSDQSRQFLWQEYASRQNYLSQGRESGQYGKDADYTITQTLEEDIADNDVESYQGIYHGRVNFTI